MILCQKFWECWGEDWSQGECSDSDKDMGSGEDKGCGVWFEIGAWVLVRGLGFGFWQAWGQVQQRFGISFLVLDWGYKGLSWGLVWVKVRVGEGWVRVWVWLRSKIRARGSG